MFLLVKKKFFRNFKFIYFIIISPSINDNVLMFHNGF